MTPIDGKADTILSGGPIWCGLGLHVGPQGAAEALALRGGKVLAAGRLSDFEMLAGPGTRRIDLRGRLAIPAFHDAHMHLMSLGRRARSLDISPGAVSSVADIVQLVGSRAQSLAPGTWITGSGYDHDRMVGKRHPTRWDLDKVSPDHPVYLGRCCGHMGVANSAALKRAGISRDTPNPPGGVIVRENGEPTGLLKERAHVAMQETLPAPTVEELVEAIELAGQRCLSYGIGSVMDACVGINGGWSDVAAYEAAERAGRLPVRVTMALAGGGLADNIAEAAFAKGYLTGKGSGMLRVGPVKFFTDGSAGGCTAAMSKPYTNGELGVLMFTDRELDEMVSHYHHRGFQVAVHAIGDAAIDQIIRSFDKACADGTCSHRRHRIEHCGFIDERQMGEMQRLGLIPAPQPVFVRDFGDTYLNVLGEQRPAGCYPMARWQRRGLRPAMSSDTPVSDVNPFVNLYAALTRTTLGGEVLGAEERLTLAEALSAYTENGAYACGVDDRLGTLEPGKVADIAVLNGDPFQAGVADLKDVEADLTLLADRVVFDRHGEVR